jgi:hypothetical protein
MNAFMLLPIGTSLNDEQKWILPFEEGIRKCYAQLNAF